MDSAATIAELLPCHVLFSEFSAEETSCNNTLLHEKSSVCQITSKNALKNHYQRMGLLENRNRAQGNSKPIVPCLYGIFVYWDFRWRRVLTAKEDASNCLSTVSFSWVGKGVVWVGSRDFTIHSHNFWLNPISKLMSSNVTIILVFARVLSSLSWSLMWAVQIFMIWQDLMVEARYRS